MQVNPSIMSGPEIGGFPDDDKLWFIKYIDQFHLGSSGSESTAVQIMLQRLPFDDPRYLRQLKQEELQGILGTRSGFTHEFRFVPKLVGELPILTIGNVYQARRKVGALKKSGRRLILRPGQAMFREICAGDSIPAPAWWKFPDQHRILNLSEYSGITQHRDVNVNFAKSRFLVYDRHYEDGSIDTFVLPRMTIFKAFYAPHTALANAFGDGRWSAKAEALLVLNETYGNLQTGIADDGHQWNVILQDGIQQEYAGLLAALYFDEYARACAEAIYGMALRDRRGDRYAPSYASADIPFQVRDQALILEFKSLELKPRHVHTGSGKTEPHKKFLITEICGCTWPAYFPRIGRAARSQAAADSETVQLAPPYMGSYASKQGDENSFLRSDMDANAGTSTTELSGEEWSWLGREPQYVKLEKKRSQHYEAGYQWIDKDGTEISAGVRTNKKSALPKAELKAVVRGSNAGLDHMFALFDTLDSKGLISKLEVVPARTQGQQATRGRFECWKFIDDASIRSHHIPPKRFSGINDIPRNSRTRYWRTALVLKFECGGQQHHWIEIERVRSEKFKSVMLTIGDRLDATGFIESALQAIVRAEGKHLSERLPVSLSPGYIQLSIYRHGYVNGELSIASLAAHLEDHIAPLS